MEYVSADVKLKAPFNLLISGENFRLVIFFSYLIVFFLQAVLIVEKVLSASN